MRTKTAPETRDSGQAAIELVGFVFMLLLVASLCVQGVFLTQSVSAAQQAARDGARGYVLGHGDVRREVERSLPDWAVIDDVNTTLPGGGVRVEVKLRVRLVVPGMTFDRFVVTRDAVMPRA